MQIKLTIKTSQGLEEIERDPNLIDHLKPQLHSCEVVFIDGEHVQAQEDEQEITRRIRAANKTT